jgi:hypothetical protein
MSFQAGDKREVLRQAVDFLVAEENIPLHPYWPGGLSGITLGVGWDAGHHRKDELAAAWGPCRRQFSERLPTSRASIMPSQCNIKCVRHSLSRTPHLYAEYSESLRQSPPNLSVHTQLEVQRT